MTSANNPTDRQGQPTGVRFGGWPDYQEWAGHDFRSRTAADTVGSGNSLFAIEVLTELLPITLPEGDNGGDGADSRTACVLLPPPRDAAFDATEDQEWVDRLDRPGPIGIDDDSLLVRPYVRVDGRVESTHQLEFETLLTATGLHESWMGEHELSEDHLIVCALCGSPRSVAEIATDLGASIGVAKVIISDALDQGLLVLHERTPIIQGRPPLALLKRVHAGIARLA